MATFKVFFSDYSAWTVQAESSEVVRKQASVEAQRRGVLVRKVKRVRE